MKVEDAFKEQISLKPETDFFTVYAIDTKKLEAGNGGLLKFAVDYNDLNEFYGRINTKYDIMGFHDNTAIPLLSQKS